MMNILSEPHNNKDNNKAFNSMEKEIANVLTMMRRTNTVGARKIPATPPKVTSKTLFLFTLFGDILFYRCYRFN